MNPSVELHVHLGGAIRHSTVLDLAKKKHIPIGAESIEDLKQLIVCDTPNTLSNVLSKFSIFLPTIIGDPDAIERVAYELCETEWRNNVLYFEVRYNPHILSNVAKNEYGRHIPAYQGKGVVTPEMVVQSVIGGLKRGEMDFSVKAKSILSCVTAYPDWSLDVLKLATEYKNKGVVGIDVAGSENGCDENFHHSAHVFEKARKRGIHRTVHAGESGDASSVRNAIELLHAERIGHGYSVLQDEEFYCGHIIGNDIHFETCPTSSVMTGSVPLDWSSHPIKRFAEDNINFSINTDDPTVFENCMQSEMKLCLEKIGLSENQIYNTQMNAAKSSFLPEDEKNLLIEKVKLHWLK